MNTQFDILKSVDSDRFAKWLMKASGHDLFPPQFLVDMGFPCAFVARLYKTHKGIIFDSFDGKRLRSTRAVHELEFWYAVAHEIGAVEAISEASTKCGRGAQAHILAAGIAQILRRDTGEARRA